jgi:hypothetical protein
LRIEDGDHRITGWVCLAEGYLQRRKFSVAGTTFEADAADGI